MTPTVVITQHPSDEQGPLGLQLLVLVKDEDLALYDQLEVWKRDINTGFQAELTAAQNSHARLPAGVGDRPSPPVTGSSVALSGTSLELSVSLAQEDVTITFSGADPISYSAAATQIVTQSLGLLDSWVDAEGKLAISTFFAGPAAYLEVLGGDAAPQLGFGVGDKAFGQAARPVLEPSVTFSDGRGSFDFEYRVRFRNSTTGAVSSFSGYFPATQSTGVLPTNMALGVVDLVDLSGKPLWGQVVHVQAESIGPLVDDRVVAGGGLVKKTDRNGHVEFVLVKGQRVTVSVPGTGLSRRIEVPTGVQVFNLMDPGVSLSADLFKVAVPVIVTAERRTL